MPHRLTARTVVLVAAGVIVLAAGGWLVSSRGTGAAAPQAAGQTEAPSAGPRPSLGVEGRGDAAAKLEQLHPPADLAQAKQVAGRFATALIDADTGTLRGLVTDRYASVLLDQPATASTADPSPAGTGAQVDGIVTRDLQPDRVLLQVLVRHHPPGRPEAVDAVNVALVRTTGGWRVDDAAF